MAYLENKIGTFTFISLQGEIIPPAQTKVVDDRPGIDGSEFTLTGVKGRPFTLISQVDTESYSRARFYLKDYQTLIDGDAVEIVQGDISGDTDGYRVSVLNVEAVDIRATAGAVGHKLNPPSMGLIVARWELIAVPIEE